MPSLLLQGFNAEKYTNFLETDSWDLVVETLVNESLGAKSLGAEGLLICGSELNPAAPELRRAIGLPVIDQMFALAETLRSFRFRRVGLLGTHGARDDGMWRTGLEEIDLLFPALSDRTWLRNSLARISSGNPIPPAWTVRCHQIMSDLARRRAEAVVVANHNLSRWMTAEESMLLPQIDAATTHAWAGAQWALNCDLRSAPPCVLEGL